MSGDLATWRARGLELAFDPAEPPAVTAAGRARLADELAHVDAARLVHHFPRDPAGKLPLGEVVLLAAVEVAPALRLPKEMWLVAASPVKRSAPQVIALALVPEIRRNAEHRWDAARWLWDARAAALPEAARWGTTALDVAALAREVGAPPAPPPLARGATADDRAAHAIRLARLGRWREALAACGVTHALDDAPAARARTPAWDAAIDAQLRACTPWRFAAALADVPPRAQHGLRLFNFPGQIATKKWGVALTVKAGTPHLAIEQSGSNERLPLVAWQPPPDLAIASGAAAAPAGHAVADAASADDAREVELLAELAQAAALDEGVLQVFGDLLAQRGSTRAQLVVPRALRKGKTATALVKTDARGWLGSLGPLVDLHTVQFERGLLARVALGSALTPFDAWPGALTPRARAELGRVTHLRLAGAFPLELARELLAPPRRHLVRLALGAPALLAAVAHPVDELEVHCERIPDLDAHWPALAKARARILRISCPPVWLGTFTNQLRQRLADLAPPIEALYSVAGVEVLIGRGTTA